jgi:hypothetical protein
VIGRAARAAIVAVACCLEAVGAAESPAIHWRPEAAPRVIEVSGVPPEILRAWAVEATAETWASRFAVLAEQGHAVPTPPMAGTWSIEGGLVRFTPQFPLGRGVRYRAELRLPGAPPLISRFELPADTTGPTTVVTQIYPTAEVLPENQLKFYLHFSAPMSRGGVYGHVVLRDSSEREIELPFLELDEELWDLAMTRLTLLIDPGRIKRGVKPLEDIGPVFEQGKSYSLTVEAACTDAAGQSLRAAFTKKFRIGVADRTPPDPARWKIHAPAAGTRGALTVEFDEPMEHALALRMIRVVAKTDGGGALAGETALTDEERRWTFVPAQTWARGRHELVVDTTIEDLAGNNIGKTFDVDLEEGAPRRLDTPQVFLEFEVK